MKKSSKGENTAIHSTFTKHVRNNTMPSTLLAMNHNNSQSHGSFVQNAHGPPGWEGHKYFITLEEMNTTLVGVKNNTAACFKIPPKNISFSNKSSHNFYYGNQKCL